MKRLLLLGCALTAMACASTAGAPTARPAEAATAADQAAVIAAVQSLFEAMRTRDTSAVRAAFAPDAQLVSIRSVPGAAPRYQVSSLSQFTASIGRAPDELVETMWDARVEVAGDLASLWAPYHFRIGPTFSHCGHDSVHLLRTPEGWKIAGIAYTVVTAGCATQ